MNYNLIYSKTENPYSSAATSELDFVQQWAEQTVEREIIRGKQLQHLKGSKQTVQELDVVDIDYGKQPFCEPSGSQSIKKPPKKRIKKRNRKAKARKGKKEESLCKCRCPKSKRTVERCPMRIAELAMPTKRQCLQNWMNNKHILPALMIERLQQIIRDQRPVVKISDAICCFKIRRPKRKCIAKDCKNKDKKCVDKSLKTGKSLSDAGVFCGLFSYKIGQILNKPMIIMLSSELEKLANEVAIDITNLLGKDQCIKRNNIKKKLLVNELSGKIAVWIWNVLEEAHQLMLEDQLKELEEEIGPVLDIIDDVVDSVVDICYVEPICEESSSESSTDAKYVELKGEVSEEQAFGGVEGEQAFEGVEGEQAFEDVEGEQAFEGVEGEQAFEGVKGEQAFEGVEGEQAFEGVEGEQAFEGVKREQAFEGVEGEQAFEGVKGEQTFGGVEGEQAFEGVEGEQAIEGEQVDVEESKKEIHPTDSFTKIELTDSKNDDIKNKISSSINSIGDELDENSSQKSLDDKEYVDANDNEDIFLNSDIGSTRQTDNADLIEDNDEERNQVSDDFNDGKNVIVTTKNISDTASSEDEGDYRIHWKSITEIKFAEPNDHLLSDADESWPQDIKFDIEDYAKSTLLIKNSVSSMGKITESEEASTEPPEQLIDPYETELTNDYNTQIITNKHLDEQNLNEVKIGDTSTTKIELDKPQSNNKSNILDKLLKESKAQQTSMEIPNIVSNKLKDTGTNTSLDSLTTSRGKKGINVTNQTLVKDTEINTPSGSLTTNRRKQGKVVTSQTLVKDTGINTSPGNMTTSRRKTEKTLRSQHLVKGPGITTSPSISTTSRRMKGKAIISQSLADFNRKTTDRKVNSKVSPSTAPFWAMQGLDSSEASKHERHIDPCQVRKWSKDLLIGYNNLKSWANWLDESSTMVMELERKKAKCCPNRREYEWMKLKKEMDNDVSIWNKQYKCTKRQLAKYNDLHRDNLVCI